MTTTQNLRQKFLQWKYAFALTIIFSTTTIGANDQLKYEKGVAPLKSRSEFCQYVAKSTNNFKTELGNLETLPEVESIEDSFDHTLFLKILSLKKSLAAYRNKKIPFINLPTSLQKIIEEKKMSLTNQIFQVEKKIDVIHSELSTNTHLKRTPSAYQIWEKENEWPLQLKVLEDQKRNLTAEVDNLDKKLFGDQDIIELTSQIEPTKKEKLIIELKFENSFFHHRLSFYPVWKTQRGYFPASETPWFQVDKKFIPQQTLLALKNKTVPPLFEIYLKFTGHPLTGEPISKIEFSEERVFIEGTPKSGFLSSPFNVGVTTPSDIALDGLLDLACIANN